MSLRLKYLKVADLKIELEERDLETSGSKSVLQERLRQALIDAGEDFEDLFEKKWSAFISELSNFLKSELSNVIKMCLLLKKLSYPKILLL